MFPDKPLLNTQSNYTKYYKSRVKLAALPDITVTITSEWAHSCRNIKALQQIICWIGAQQPFSPCSFLISKVLQEPVTVKKFKTLFNADVRILIEANNVGA